ncbi:MAG: hypothetical protein JM58_17905, partial [Peptococcaceae bacterium BICA1-8]
PPACKAGALPAELIAQVPLPTKFIIHNFITLVKRYFWKLILRQRVITIINLLIYLSTPAPS